MKQGIDKQIYNVFYHLQLFLIMYITTVNFFIFSTFKDFVIKSGLTDRLTADEQITVLAPSNEAFESMSKFQKNFFLESEKGIRMVRSF